jgi:hypothetical protein
MRFQLSSAGRLREVEEAAIDGKAVAFQRAAQDRNRSMLKTGCVKVNPRAVYPECQVRQGFRGTIYVKCPGIGTGAWLVFGLKVCACFRRRR